MAHKTVIATEPCLTETQMLKYVEGTLTREEERALDRHIASCDLCSDAMEGAMRLSSSDLKSRLVSIEKKIDTQFSIQKLTFTTPQNEQNTEGVVSQSTIPKAAIRFRLLRWVASAAAILLLVGTLSIWLLTTNAPNDEIVADIKTEESPNLTPTTLDTSTQIVSGIAVLSDNNSPKSTIPKAKNNEIVAIEAPIESKTTSPPATIRREGKDNIFLENNTSALENIGESEKQVERKDTKSGQIADEMAMTQAKENREEAVLKKKDYNSTRAPSMPQKSLIDSDEEQMYQRGLIYYHNQDYKNALTNFNKIEENTNNNNLFENAQWYAAMSYLQKGDKANAKQVFETIVKNKGKYAPQASDILKKQFKE